SVSYRYSSKYKVRMLKLIFLFALVATVTPATFPGALRQYSTKPPVFPAPLSRYSPLPSPTYSPQPYGKFIAILRSESDIAPDGSQYHYARIVLESVSYRYSSKYKVRMLKLIFLSALVATVTPATFPGALRQYSTKPPVFPAPLSRYSPLPSPTYSPQPYGKFIAILRSESDIAPDGSQYHYA
ncbi:COPII coat assembly protein sec16-like, partial [Anoplophora glabripennis]|uniref:COPII coat assembly protein sec16-like n=1 Tax=Anoplophora glabripennis TaxID=217634 RepID=UPI000C781929